MVRAMEESKLSHPIRDVLKRIDTEKSRASQGSGKR